MRNILCRFQNLTKNPKKNFNFGDNGVGTSCGNLFQILQEYMLLPANVLPNSPKISDLTKRNVF